jgi:hypothetical protein
MLATWLCKLPDLFDLVLDLGDVVHHLLDRLDQVGDVDDGDALGVVFPVQSAAAMARATSGQARFHGKSFRQARPLRAARR